MRKRRGTRDLLGVQSLTPYSAVTARGELVFIALAPTNTSVLSMEGLRERIYALTTVLSGLKEAELVCMDASERFTGNQLFLRQRIEQERYPAIREMLEQDAKHFDDIRINTATARRFLLVLRTRDTAQKDLITQVSQAEQILQEHRFHPRRLEAGELRQLIAVYFEQNVTAEEFPEHDGGLEGEKSFWDMVAPSTIQFYPDHYIFGNTYRSVWSLREYPTTTEAQALLCWLGERAGVTLHLYLQQVDGYEANSIFTNAANRNRMVQGSTNDLRQTVEAETNLQDVATLIASMQRSREPLIRCAVYMELAADTPEHLSDLQAGVTTELSRSKLNVDKLLLRQQQGYWAAQPWGHNSFGTQFQRVLPASSVANLYPMHYSGKTDPHGFYLGRDKFGSNIIVDFDRRTQDRSNGHVIILGNSGQGKSYLLKLLLCIVRESGKRVICFDVDQENRQLAEDLGGCYVDLSTGDVKINPLEPKSWGNGAPEEVNEPGAFRQIPRLSQHISFLRDWFQAYKSFSTQEIDIIEILLTRLYAQWHLTDSTDYDKLGPTDYPTLSDLYRLMERTYRDYEDEVHPIFTRDALQKVLLGLNSLCVGAESQFFDGHTNITSSHFLVFGLKGILDAGQSVRNAAMFNLLSYMSHQLLHVGNTAAFIEELHTFMSDRTAISYIRTAVKRARKMESMVVMATQNLDGFDAPGIREYVRPLFAIPSHQFLFNAGTVDRAFFMENLQLEPSEYELIQYPEKGTCLYKCGNERFLLEVKAPPHKEEHFGTGGGR